MQRLTTKWTDTLEEAFGPQVKRARDAEIMVMDAFTKWGYEVIDHESDRDLQTQGLDFSIRKNTWRNFYSIDVKANLDSYGSYYVDLKPDGWLFNPKKTSDRICHACVETGWFLWYGRDDMKNYIHKMNFDISEETVFKITPKIKLDFVTRRNANKERE